MDLKIIKLWERNQKQKSTYYEIHLYETLEVEVIQSDKKADPGISGDRGKAEWGIDGKWVHGPLEAEGYGSGYAVNTVVKTHIIVHLLSTITSQPCRVGT